jgi:SRSO17 transposase
VRPRIGTTGELNRIPKNGCRSNGPADEKESAWYWLSTLPADTALVELAHLVKHRWIIERDYQELKQELGLGHYEGRAWRSFYHHATLCIAAYGFLVAKRNRFSPSAWAGPLD